MSCRNPTSTAFIGGGGFVVALQRPDRRPHEHYDDQGDRDTDDDTLEHRVGGRVGQCLVIALVNRRLRRRGRIWRAWRESTEVDAGDYRDRSSTLAIVIRSISLCCRSSPPRPPSRCGSPAASRASIPDPSEAQAGSTLSVAFTIEHGCDGSPTVQLDMRLPDGVTDAKPEPFEGFESSIDGDVISYLGGPLADDQEATFTRSR